MKVKATNKKQQKKKLILTVIAVGAAGVLGYFGWQYWKRKKAAGSAGAGSDLDEGLKTVAANNSAINNNIPAASTSKPKPTGSATKSQADQTGFPLKKGSKGEKVRQLQEALVAKHGPSILPKYGADGDFGTETVNALKKAGLPALIDFSTFHVIVQGTGAAPADATTTGNELSAAVFDNNFKDTLNALKKMKSTDDYSAANEVFKQYRLVGGVRQTIVNGLLNAFTKADQKEKIKYEFLRMGLQFDGKKWSLSGLDGLPIMTVTPATVWINAYKGVKVPARMVLGNEVCKRLDYTLFCNHGKYFLVHSNCVKHL